MPKRPSKRSSKRSGKPGGQKSARRGRPPESAIAKARQREQANRPAFGREKVLVQSDDARWLGVVLDAIARHRATQDPLDKVYAGLAKSQRLGANERSRGQAVLFSWTRARAPISKYIDGYLQRTGGLRPRVRDLDRAALYLCVDEDVRESLPPLSSSLIGLLDGEVDLRPGLPDWLRAELKRFDEPKRLADALLARAPVALCVPDTEKHNDIVAAFEATGREVRRGSVHSALLSTDRIPRDDMKRIVGDAGWPMDEGSQIIAHTVHAATPPGEPVLDLCAGGGGKSLLLTRLGRTVVGVDVDRTRLKNAKIRAAEDAAVWIVADAARTRAVADGSFATVLVDAPCSGTGTLRRAPDVMFRTDKKRAEAYFDTQYALLNNALRAVKADGVVIYATCSLMRRENEGVVETMIKNDKAMPVALSSLGYSFPFAIADDAHMMTMRPDIHGTDGFFIAALKPA